MSADSISMQMTRVGFSSLKNKARVDPGLASLFSKLMILSIVQGTLQLQSFKFTLLTIFLSNSIFLVQALLFGTTQGKLFSICTPNKWPKFGEKFPPATIACSTFQDHFCRNSGTQVTKMNSLRLMNSKFVCIISSTKVPSFIEFTCCFFTNKNNYVHQIQMKNVAQ